MTLTYPFVLYSSGAYFSSQRWKILHSVDEDRFCRKRSATATFCTLEIHFSSEYSCPSHHWHSHSQNPRIYINLCFNYTSDLEMKLRQFVTADFGFTNGHHPNSKSLWRALHAFGIWVYQIQLMYEWFSRSLAGCGEWCNPKYWTSSKLLKWRIEHFELCLGTCT